jgi:fumarate reductase subunit D
MIKGALVIIQTLGLIVILKSLHVFHKISKGQQSQHTTQQAIGWLIFGGAAFQAQNTILMLASSVGMQSEVSALIK